MEGKEWTKVFPVFCSPRLQPSKPSRDRRRQRGERGASFSFFLFLLSTISSPFFCAGLASTEAEEEGEKRRGEEEPGEKS